MYNHLRKKIALVMALLMFFSNVPFVALAGSFTGLTQDVSKNEGSVSKILAANPVEDTHTYTFMVDGEQLGDKQIVKNGQHLVEPQAPEKPNYKFKGWYVGDEKVKFGESNPIAVTSTEEFTANARFEEVYYVFFMDGTGSDPRVFTTKDGTAGDSVSTDVTLPIGSTQAVTGWYKDKDLTDGPVSDPYIIGTSNQTLWPKIEEGHYLYFVSGENGTYIEPQFVLPTGTTTKPDPNPTRPGYTFSHWSTTQGGPAYSFGQPITADVTLYAVWTPKTDTSYTVVFWKQSVNDSQNADDDAKTYDYAESVVRTAETGATVSPTTPDRNKNYNGFKYNSAKSISVTVKGDGTTILNVYYDRNKLTIDFHRNGEYGAEDGEYTGLYGQTLAQNGYTWPSSHRWTRYDWGGTTLTFLDAFIFDGLWGNGISIDLYAQSHSGTRDIVHYKEALDGTWVEAISLKGSGTFTFTNKYTGFTVSQYRTKRSNGTWTDWQSATGSASVNYGMEIRHARNSYDLAFYNYNTTVRKETLKFEASLTEFASYQPPRPAGLPEEYIFQGWYKDEAYSESFNFATETMPSNDLMIYAEWAPPEVTATIHLALAGGGTVTKTLTYNQSIDPATMPTVKDHNGNVLSQGDDSNIVTVPENHKWIGWTTKVGASYISYNFSTLVLSDIELYPYYVNNAPFTVTYNAGGGTGTPPEDSNQYAVGAYADVKSALGLTAPTDKVFLGWENGGTIYQPGDKIQITGNMTLTAQWGTVKDKTQVTYKPGIGAIGSDHVVDEMLINQSFTLKNVGECGFTAKPNYEFKGWLNATDNKVYQPGVQLQVDDENQGTQNILTAQWAPILTVTSGDKSWSYDGNSHTYKQYTLVYGDQTIIGDEGQTSFTMNDDKTVTITPTGKGASGVKTVSDNSDNNNTFTVSTTAEQGTHVFGTLSITAVTDKVTVTITENSGTELYDGSEKTVTGYTVTSISNPLYTVDDFTFSGTASVSGTNAGTYDMELEPGDFTNNSANFTNVTFVIVDGTLTINPKAVTISTGGGEKEYDGSALTNATVGIEGLVDGESVTLTATGSQTEVGISDNTYDIEWDNAKESNYTVTDNLGELKVTTSAAEVILTAPSDSKIYDGTALTKTTGVTWTGLPADFTVEATASGSQTDAGSSANVVNDGYVIKDAGGNNKTANFTDITKVPGTLKVTPKPVTISTGGGEKEYDGIALTNAIVGIEGLVDGESVTLAASGSQTEVGSSANTYSITWDNAKAANYTVTNNLGTLTVTKNAAAVVLTAPSDSKTYDGTALTKTTGVTWTGLPAGFTVEATASGSQTDAGSSDNVVDDGYVIKDADDNDKTANFTNVTTEKGTLTVNPKAVTITTGSDSKAYDGTALTNSTVGIEGLVDGESVTLAASGSQTEVGSSANTYSITWDNAKAANYTVTNNLGTLTVTKNAAAVVLTAPSDSKTYDGTVLTKTTGVTWTGLPAGFTVEATASGSQTDAGSSDNVVDDGYVIKDADDNVKTANFTNVTTEKGTLTVNPKAVTITTGSDSKAYDGTALTNATVDIEGLVDGESVTLATTGSQTEVGSSDNTYNIEWDNAKAANYTVTNNLGTLTVTKNAAAVVLTAPSDSKIYDGTALTKTTGVTWAGLPAGFTVEATASGSQTDAGSSDNVVDDGYVIKDADDNDKTANFTNVTTEKGTLTVNPKVVTITTGSDSKAYDGTALTNSTVGIEGLVDGESVTLVATGSQTEVGSSNNTYSITWDYAKASNYTVTDNLGELKVTKSAAEVILTAPSDSKTYDGTALTKTTVVTATGLPEGFKLEATATGSQTDAGSSDNVVNDDYVIKDADDNDKTANFTNVTKVKGTLTINPRRITLIGNSDTKTYNGVEQSVTGFVVSGLVSGHKIADSNTLQHLAKGIMPGEYDGAFDMGELVIYDDADNNVTTNYYIVEKRIGKLTITDAGLPLKLEKTVDDNEVDKLQTVTYTYTITNNGDVDISNFIVTDDKLDTVKFDETVIPPGKSIIATLTYAVDQDDIDFGKDIVNIATLKVNDRVEATDTETVKVIQRPGMSISKRLVSINGDTTQQEFTKAGDVLAYEVVVTNTGNVTLKNVQLTDSLVDLTTAKLTESMLTNGQLEVGETWTYTYTYTTKQADVDNGSVFNSVNGSSDAPNPENPEEPTPVVPDKPGTEEVPADQKPGMSISKSLVSINGDTTQQEFTKAGDVLAYEVVVTNTGNVTLKGLKITDTLVPFENMKLKGDTNGDGNLQVDEVWTFTYTYTVTQDDVNAGKVLNKVAVTKPDNPENPNEPNLPSTVDEHIVPGPAFLDIETTINPTKSLSGRAMKAGEFEFALRQGTTTLQRVTNDAEGNIIFPALKYTQKDIGKTFNYTIVERAGNEANMSYSTMAINFTVFVEDAGSGVLKLTVSTASANVIFFNTYTAPASEPEVETDEPAPVAIPVQNFDLGVAPSNVADCFE